MAVLVDLTKQRDELNLKIERLSQLEKARKNILDAIEAMTQSDLIALFGACAEDVECRRAACEAVSKVLHERLTLVDGRLAKA